VFRAGLAASFLIHLGLLLALRMPVPDVPASGAAGPDPGDDRAAEGVLEVLNVRAAPVVAITQPPVPVPVEVTVEAVREVQLPEVDAASVLGDAPGLDEPPGLATGSGAGDRGVSESGVSALQPPSPRGMIIPPTNRDLRGTEIQVWVFVDATGAVVPDSTRLEPPTKDRDFNRRLIREASEWVFRPASRDGRPIAAWFPYRIIM